MRCTARRTPSRSRNVIRNFRGTVGLIAVRKSSFATMARHPLNQPGSKCWIRSVKMAVRLARWKKTTSVVILFPPTTTCSMSFDHSGAGASSRSRSHFSPVALLAARIQHGIALPDRLLATRQRTYGATCSVRRCVAPDPDCRLRPEAR